jgi:hypothetical protein
MNANYRPKSFWPCRPVAQNENSKTDYATTTQSYGIVVKATTNNICHSNAHDHVFMDLKPEKQDDRARWQIKELTSG